MAVIQLFNGITSPIDALRVMDETLQAYERLDNVNFNFNGQLKDPSEVLIDCKYPMNGFQENVYSDLIKRVNGESAVRITRDDPVDVMARMISLINISLTRDFDPIKVEEYLKSKDLEFKQSGIRRIAILDTDTNEIVIYGKNTIKIPYSVNPDLDAQFNHQRIAFERFKELTKSDDITKLLK